MWVDGSPRAACVTPVRRLHERQITTLEGLPAPESERWVTALVATGGSQCGFCTPGIVMRLAALGLGPAPGGPASDRPAPVSGEQVDRALLAHLCRCTGWQTIEEAADLVSRGPQDPEAEGPRRDLNLASVRATLEGGVPQEVGPGTVLGRAGFADDTCPPGALTAVPDGAGGYVLAESVGAARAQAGKVQGRRSSLALDHPVALPPGELGSDPADHLGGAGVRGARRVMVCARRRARVARRERGAFGGKLHSPVGADARRLADGNGRPVRVLWSREDVVRLGPKRPPVAAGLGRGGSGVLRVGVPPDGFSGGDWESLAADVGAVAPGLVLEAVPLHGPAISLDLRAAVWAEAAALAACARAMGEVGRRPVHDVPVEITAPTGGRAVARCRPDDSIEVVVDAGPVLDEVVLRSYCIGAAHQALGWVGTEGIAVDAAGAVHDLTMRSFGILAARDMPSVSVTMQTDGDGPAVNGSDAVFAAVAAARWLADGLPPLWPTQRRRCGPDRADPAGPRRSVDVRRSEPSTVRSLP